MTTQDDGQGNPVLMAADAHNEEQGFLPIPEDTLQATMAMLKKVIVLPDATTEDDIRWAATKIARQVIGTEAARTLATLTSTYVERNRCVAALARAALDLGLKAGLAHHQPSNDPDWDPAWLNVVFIDLPTGQVSWHMHANDMPFFAWLPKYDRPYDGHSTDEKYDRLHAWASRV